MSMENKDRVYLNVSTKTWDDQYFSNRICTPISAKCNWQHQREIGNPPRPQGLQFHKVEEWCNLLRSHQSSYCLHYHFEFSRHLSYLLEPPNKEITVGEI